jgi:nucleoid DNA-binding protein
MIRKTISQTVSKKFNLTQRESDRIVQFILTQMRDALRRAESIELRGFGSFHFYQATPRIFQDPKTNKVITIPGGNRVVFRPSKNLFPRPKRNAS